jgi:hypothetical protein
MASDYITALTLTLVIELPVYLVGLTFPEARRWQAALVLGLGVNLISHPIAFLAVYPMLEGPAGGAAALVVTELAVVLGEAAMMWSRRIPPRVALLTGACANIASLVLGVAITTR